MFFVSFDADGLCSDGIIPGFFDHERIRSSSDEEGVGAARVGQRRVYEPMVDSVVQPDDGARQWFMRFGARDDTPAFFSFWFRDVPLTERGERDLRDEKPPTDHDGAVMNESPVATIPT